MELAELVKKVEAPQGAQSPAPLPVVDAPAQIVQPERRHVPPEAPRVHGERAPHKESAAPLSMLKTHPKKDKGPSEQNLSSLRDALSAVMVKKEEKQPEQAVPSVPSESKPQGERFTREPVRSEAPKQETPREVASAIPPPPPRSPLLDSPFAPPPPSEIPEDVLKKVLAD